MSKAMDRFRRVGKAYSHGLDVLGDDDNKTLAINALAEVGQTVAQTIAKKQAQDAAVAGNKEKSAAVNSATEARKYAQMAAAEALGETDEKGPLHKRALDADTKARVAEAKASIYTGGMGGGGKMPSYAPPHATPWWYYALGIVGVGAVGTVGYKVIKR